MNKSFYPLLLAAMAFGMNAQAETFHYLDKVTSTSGFDIYDYRYDKFNKVTEIHHVDQDDLMSSTYRAFEYDDKQQVVKELVFQDYYETEFLSQYKLVIRYDYEWNDKGQMVKRQTWNKETIDSDFYESATLEFVYDEDGKLGEVLTSFPKVGRVQRDLYFYNEEGQLTKRESWSTLYGNSYLSNTMAYTYNVVGDLANITGYDYDGATANLRINSIIDLNYNSDGDLQDVTEWNATRTMKLSKKEYEYTTDFALEDTVYPYNFEDDYWTATGLEYTLVKHPILSRTEYAMNEVTSELEFNDKYEYFYTEELKAAISNLAAVEAITIPGTISATFNSLRNGMLKLDGIADFDSVSIVDMEGRQMMNRAYNCGINVSNLAPGAYFAITTNGVVKFVK